MCGIGGYLGDPQQPYPLLPGALTLRHRGPDAQASVHFRSVGGVPGYLAAARLAILDPSSAGAQPMASSDGTLLLVHNGEIYNHRELRVEFAALGAGFRSVSDTEVILAGYQHLGAALWRRLRGMFALALWDGTRQLLWLVRDAMGIKPLYYAGAEKRLVFASEVRALVAAQAVPGLLERQALTGYLSWGSVPEPATLIAGIKMLPPGHSLCLRATAPGRLDAPAPERFAPPIFAISSDPRSGPRAQLGAALSRGGIASRLGATLHEAVRLHLESDVQVGLLLSGGVDSTALAALIPQAAQAARLTQPFTAFTLGTGAEGALDDETVAAAETARLLGLRHQVCMISAEDALAAAPRFLAALDQPSVDGFNTFLICERVRAADHKLVLSGLGGDELFLGYGLHRSFAALWAVAAAPARALGRERWLGPAIYRQLRGLWPPSAVRALLRPDLRTLVDAAAVAAADLMAETVERGLASTWHHGLQLVRALEQQNYLLHTLLRDGDVMSMAHGVELRVPLCDRDLWSEVASLGPAGLVPRKRLLVEAVAAIAPLSATRLEQLSRAAKRGFVLPLSTWLAGPLGSSLAARFTDPELAAAAGLHPRALSRLLAIYQRAAGPLRSRLTYRMWALYVLLSYVEQHGLRLE